MNRIHIYEERLRKVSEKLRETMAISKACLDVGITLDQYKYAQKIVNTTKNNRNLKVKTINYQGNSTGNPDKKTGKLIVNTNENIVNSGVNANENSGDNGEKPKKKGLKLNVKTNKNNSNTKRKTKESNVKLKVKTSKSKGNRNVKTEKNNVQSGGNHIVKSGKTILKTRTPEENQKLYDAVKKYYEGGLSLNKSCIKAGIKSGDYYKICKSLNLKSAACDNSSNKNKNKNEEILEKEINKTETQIEPEKNEKNEKIKIYENFDKKKVAENDFINKYLSSKIDYKARANYFQNKIDERAKKLATMNLN